VLTVLAMATQVETASHDDPKEIILTFVAFHAIVVALFLRADRLYPGLRGFSIRYAAGFGLAAAIWLVSLTLPEGMRPWVWAAALAVDLVTPWMAERAAAERTFDVSYIPERYGLFTLIVVGEAIIAVARHVRGAMDAGSDDRCYSRVRYRRGDLVAYFAHPHAELLERGPLASFVWGYGHIFVWMGIAITGVGIGLGIEAAATGHALSDGERRILCGGPALYLMAMALLRSAGAGHFTDRLVVIRLATAVVFVVIWLAGGALSPKAIALMAVVAVAAGIAIGRAWRRLGSTAS
jgi:low temperature requirement protein LtrA